MCLRAENQRLQAECDALRQRLMHYEEPRTAVRDPMAIARAVAEAYGGGATSSDWIAAYWVLTTYAGAPASLSAFAGWVGALPLAAGCMPPCKASLLYKADPVYMKPLYRWVECTSVRDSTLQRRLQIARTLKQQLA